MCLQRSNTLRTIGFVFLILASLSKWFNLSDGLTGLLYGITIGSLLVSIRRMDRQRSA